MSLLKTGCLVHSALRRNILCVSKNPIQRLCSTKTTDTGDKEVYYGALAPQIKGVKMFSLMTSVAGVVAQPVLYQQVTNMGGGMSLTIALGSFVGFFTFVTPFLLHMVTKRYVTKIVYNEKEDNYTATTFTFFLQPNHMKFKPEDVQVPDITGIFTTFLVKGKPLFVDSRLFGDVKHYAKIMGLDKPLDFGFEENIKKSSLKENE